MLHTIESNTKRRGLIQFDAVSSAICKFCKSAPSIPVLDVHPVEGNPYKLIRYTYGSSFLTIRTVGKVIEISVHKRYEFDVPNDLYADRNLVDELKAYLTRYLVDVKWRIKQSRGK